jgi:hypothetical protein
MIEVQVPANEKRAQELLHLHSDVERDGDDEVVENQKCQEIRDELQDLSTRKWVVDEHTTNGLRPHWKANRDFRRASFLLTVRVRGTFAYILSQYVESYPLLLYGKPHQEMLKM